MSHLLAVVSFYVGHVPFRCLVAATVVTGFVAGAILLLVKKLGVRVSFLFVARALSAEVLLRRVVFLPLSSILAGIVSSPFGVLAAEWSRARLTVFEF